MYVKRDAKEHIVLVSAESSDGCGEYLASDDPELLAFIEGRDGAGHERMRESDLEFVRVLEDVIGLLMDKGIIRFTDLPQVAQEKFSERQSMRRKINSVGLMDESSEADDEII